MMGLPEPAEGMRKACVLNPYEVAARSAFADTLIEAGGDFHNWGEFMRIQLAMEGTRHNHRHKKDGGGPCEACRLEAGLKKLWTDPIVRGFALGGITPPSLRRAIRLFIGPGYKGTEGRYHVYRPYDTDGVPMTTRETVTVRGGMTEKLNMTTERFFGQTCHRCRGTGERLKRDHDNPGSEIYKRCVMCDGVCRVGGIGRTLVHLHPIKYVTLNDQFTQVEPVMWEETSPGGDITSRQIGQYYFWDQSDEEIPALMNRATDDGRMGFPTEIAANDWLSDRCIRWAKGEIRRFKYRKVVEV